MEHEPSELVDLVERTIARVLPALEASADNYWPHTMLLVAHGAAAGLGKHLRRTDLPDVPSEVPAWWYEPAARRRFRCHLISALGLLGSAMVAIDRGDHPGAYLGAAHAEISGAISSLAQERP